MFRRRIPRNRRRPGSRGPHPRLQEANDLLASGDFAGAARLFDEMAQAAMSRKGPAAPHLLIQAGRAMILAGQVPEGIMKIKQALDVFAQRMEWARFVRTRKRATKQLRESGFEQEAEEIENYQSGQVPNNFLDQINGQPVKPVSKAVSLLPVSCPGCGGPIRSDRVEWVDEVTAECPYCGRMLRN